MPLPQSLQQKLEDAFGETDKMLVQSERYRLSESYRDEKRSDHHKRRIENSYQRLSYLATRVPATYGVCESVFSRLAAYDLEFNSLLDLGSGPGTAAICAKYIFPEIARMTLVDQDKEFKVFAQSFLKAPLYAKTSVTYALNDLKILKAYPKNDLITCSYALNELKDEDAKDVVHKAWLATEKALVLIEPGTPKASQRLIKRRQELIDYGATILAPCPHQGPCPLDGHAEDWCHFSERIERSNLHRFIKDSTLPYEDEKYAYVIAVREKNIDTPAARIIKKPRKRPGHMIFDLCSDQGLMQQTVTKSDKSLYKMAKNLDWGDEFEA